MTDMPFQTSNPNIGAPNIGTVSLLRAATFGLALLIGGLGGAAVLIPINGAVVASGQIRVEGKPQPVQSLDPGIVTTVAVKNGDHVTAGDVLLALDPTLAQARLDIAREQLASALAEEARLLAEAQGSKAPDFTPPALPFSAPDMTRANARQQAMFEARRAQSIEAQARLIETEAQLVAQSDGVKGQISAAQQEATLLQDEMRRMRSLVDQGLARQSPLSDLQRQESALIGRLASLDSEIARLQASRRDARVALNQQERDRAAEVAQGLRDSGAKIAQSKAEILQLAETLARSTLRAPVSGIVHELAVSAPGAVVGAGTTLALIVPTDRALEIEVNVDPRNIESVHLGQEAEIMLSIANASSMPRLSAHVTQVPPGAVTDETTNRSFYRVTLALADGVLPPGIDLVPGMPVEAFLATGERPLLSWLLAPLIQPMARAFRED